MESDLRKGSRDLGEDTVIYDCMYQIIICKQSKEQFICTINMHLFCYSIIGRIPIRIKIDLKSEVKKKKKRL